MKLRPMKTEYELLKALAAVSHGKVNIAGGNVFQHEIFLAIKESGKHKEVYEGYPIALLSGERKTHKVDILIVDEDSVTAINSKGKSFNSTDSEDAKVGDVRKFTAAIEKAFPDKKVTYQFLKDEYGSKRIKLYEYFEQQGIPVFNTEDYLIRNYDTNFTELEQRRQTQCVQLFKDAFDGDYDNLLQVLDPRRVTVNKPARSGRHGDLDAL